MKQLHMRGFPPGLFLLNSVLSIVIIAFSFLALNVMQYNGVPLGVRFLISTMVIVFLLMPGIMMLLVAIVSFFTEVEIYDNRIVYKRLFRKRECFSLDQITFFGSCAWARRSCRLFFCTEDPAVIKEYYQSHRQLCRKIFGPEQFERLSDCEEGRFRLAVGTYLRCSRKNVFTLRHGSTKRLHQVVQAMKKDAILTGSMLIKEEPSWIKYSIATEESDR